MDRLRYIAHAFSVLLVGLIMCTAASVARAEKLRESKVKVAMVYKITEDAKFPKVAAQRTTVCVLGNGMLTRDVGELEGADLAGRKLSVRAVAATADFGDCLVLLAAASADTTSADALRRAAQAGVLTFGETERFTRQGGMVGLVARNNKVGIDVNLPVTRKAGFAISARLLRLANVLH